MNRTFSLFAAGIVLTTLGTPSLPVYAQTQGEMNQEANTDYKKADAELNAIYKKLLLRLDKIGQAKLKKSQLAWITFRDREVEFAADTFRGGSMSPMVASNAAARITRERTKMLNDYKSDFDNR